MLECDGKATGRKFRFAKARFSFAESGIASTCASSLFPARRSTLKKRAFPALERSHCFAISICTSGIAMRRGAPAGRSARAASSRSITTIPCWVLNHGRKYRKVRRTSQEAGSIHLPRGRSGLIRGRSVCETQLLRRCRTWNLRANGHTINHINLLPGRDDRSPSPIHRRVQRPKA